MAGYIMIFLLGSMIVTLITMLIMRKGWKRILLTFGKFLLVIILFNFYVRNTCNPDTRAVELMTPQAEVITNYILKNGIPESMMRIPNLPSPWDRCERVSTNTEYCYFHINDNEYSTYLNTLVDKSGADIWIKTYNKKSETGISTKILKHLKNGMDTYKIQYPLKPYSTKNDGICNPMRM